MKNIIAFLVTLILFNISNSQTITFDEIKSMTSRPKKGDYTSYKASNGEEFIVGNKIKIGQPSETNGTFRNIIVTDGAFYADYASSNAIGWEAEIKKFVFGGTKRQGFFATAVCKTESGLNNYNIIIEKCLDSNEIVSSILSRDDAIAKLKQAKDLLDLEMMTQEEYDKLKSELAPIIMNNQ